MKRYLPIVGILLLWSCTPGEQIAEEPDTEQPEVEEELQMPERPVPYPIDYPREFDDAILNGTRSASGRPGPEYWQQFAEYDISAELVPEDHMLYGRVRITYHNNSPDDLNNLHLELIQNHHAEGVIRNEEAEITGGMELYHVEVEGTRLEDGDGYSVNNTRLVLDPEDAIESGETVDLMIRYSFQIPQQGAGGRMGYSDDNVFYIGYWYPQMVVYDDVLGWHPDDYLGRAEFYHGFADYNLSITAPENWLILGTGELLNGEEVLQEKIYDRAQQAWQSDTTYQVITADDLGDFTQPADAAGTLTWQFHAEDVRDVAFSATSESLWDAARTPVGEPDENGDQQYAKVNSVYRESADLWPEVTEYQQHALTFLSEFKGFDYPWPHMTAVEGEGIIGGGMEFPMMTIIADYNEHGEEALYNVTAHELAHMWVPLIVSTDERRYGWLDEGNTVFSTNEAREDFGISSNHNLTRQQYLHFARLDRELPMMRRSNYHYTMISYVTASYNKPSAVLFALRGLLGDDVFEEAYRQFINRWAYKHAYPWDMFNTFEEVSGKDLEWFWRTWYYETWNLQQEIKSVESAEDGTRIVIEDKGEAPMPVRLQVTTADGNQHYHEIDVEIWLSGRKSAEKIVPYDFNDVTRVIIDADRQFPMVNRGNARWEPGE